MFMAAKKNTVSTGTGLDAQAESRNSGMFGNKALLAVLAVVFIAAVATVAVVIFAGMGAGSKKSSSGNALSALFDSGCVGVIDIKGEIATDDTPNGVFSQGSPGSATIAQEIDDASSNDNVKSLLFVIDSPGGSVVATQEIYDAIERSNKPKVAYFRETAASGGYYVGSAADYIISEPAAITGSIGVRATFNDLSNLLDKVGVNTTIVKSGQFKDIGDPTRPMTDDEKQIIQSMVDEIFQDFKSAVLKHRGSKLDMAQFNKILDARVLSGRQAYAIGLVDALGNQKDALAKAAALGGLQNASNPRTCSFDSQSGGLFSGLFSGASSVIGSSIGRAFYIPQLDSAKQLQLSYSG